MPDKVALPKIKNPLAADLGFFGKLDEPGGLKSKTFFKNIEKNQDSETVLAMRDLYEDVLEDVNFPAIEKKIQRFAGKISAAESSARLKELMGNLVSEGLVQAKNGNGRAAFYNPNPKISRTQALIKAYLKRKKQLKREYAKITSCPGGIRLEGYENNRRYGFVCAVEFGKNKHDQETVTVTDALPLYGQPPAEKGRSYVVGYNVPNWLKEHLPELRGKVKAAEAKEAEEAEKADSEGLLRLVDGQDDNADGEPEAEEAPEQEVATA